MKKILIFVFGLLAGYAIFSAVEDYRIDYTLKDAVRELKDSDRIAVMKTRDGHIRDYVVVKDTSYWVDSPDCEKCRIEDSLKQKKLLIQNINNHRRYKKMELID